MTILVHLFLVSYHIWGNSSFLISHFGLFCDSYLSMAACFDSDDFTDASSEDVSLPDMPSLGVLRGKPPKTSQVDSSPKTPQSSVKISREIGGNPKPTSSLSAPLGLGVSKQGYKGILDKTLPTRERVEFDMSDSATPLPH